MFGTRKKRMFHGRLRCSASVECGVSDIEGFHTSGVSTNLEQHSVSIYVRPSFKSFWQVLMALSILFRRVHRLLDALWPWNCF